MNQSLRNAFICLGIVTSLSITTATQAASKIADPNALSTQVDQSLSAPQTSCAKVEDPLAPLPREAALKKLPTIHATTYFLVDQHEFSCVGKYGRHTYNGNETIDISIKKNDGTTSKMTICRRLYWSMVMEGSGIVYNADGEPITIGVNTSSKKNDVYGFEEKSDCRFSFGASGECLVPYHTVATDLTGTGYKKGDIIYIPSARGIELPNGERHSGYFTVGDTGGAFIGAGRGRLDLYVGNSDDQDNAFLGTTLLSSKGITDAFLVTGADRKIAEAEIDNALKSFEATINSDVVVLAKKSDVETEKTNGVPAASIQ